MTDSKTTTELLPCPFCGGEATKMSYGTEDDLFWWVECRECNATIDNRATSAEAIAAWNTRADEPQVIQKAEKYKLADSQKQLEADVIKMCHMHTLQARPFLDLLDRQAAITRAEVFEGGEFDCFTCDAKRELQERVDSLTDEVEAQRKRANDAERGVLSAEWYVCRDRYEDDVFELQQQVDELTAERTCKATRQSSFESSWRCECGGEWNQENKPNYCPNCGRKVKWN